MLIKKTQKLTERGNKFVGHIAKVTNATEIGMAVSAIKHASGSRLSGATHNMYGARVVVNGSTQEYSDDDGEYGGSKFIMQELRKANMTNVVVVVSRWNSGIQLGQRRFDIISQCTIKVISTGIEGTQITHQQIHQDMELPAPSQSTTSPEQPQQPVLPQLHPSTDTQSLIRPPIFNPVLLPNAPIVQTYAVTYNLTTTQLGNASQLPTSTVHMKSFQPLAAHTSVVTPESLA